MNMQEQESIRLRKKRSYKPIMVASKQIKPGSRTNDIKYEWQKRFSQHKTKYDDLHLFKHTNYVFDSYQFTHKKKELKTEEQAILNSQLEHNKSVSATVVNVSFSESRNLRFNGNTSENIEEKKNHRLTHFVKIKTHDNNNTGKCRVAYRKNVFHLKNFKLNTSNEENFESMKISELSINKVNPKKKNRVEIDISPQKIQQISKKVDFYQKSLIKRYEEKYRSTSTMLSRQNTEKDRIKSEEDNQIFRKSKIEEDVFTKRKSPQKQHFVFGMGETPGKNSLQTLIKKKFEFYKDFLWKINFTNGIYVKLKDTIENPYKVFIGKGNNSNLLRVIIKKRFWWQVVDKNTSEVHLLWTQLKVNDFFASQKQKMKNTVNKIVDLKSRTIFSSLQQKLKEELGNQDEERLIFNENDYHRNIMMCEDYSLWINHYQRNKIHEDKFENVMPKRIKTLIRRKKMQYVTDSKNLRIHNHFQCNYFLGNKKALFYSMKNYYKLFKKNPFNFIPLTFHISKGLDDPQFEKFSIIYNKLEEEKANNEFKNIWILKPGQFTNRGKGITVCSNFEEIKNKFKGKDYGKNRTFILQKYIERPFLYSKRKFDIRHFMLVTCVNGAFKGYEYSQGYIRTSSNEYNIKNCKNIYTHLTNDSIQQTSQDYGKYEKGNKLSYHDLERYLISQNKKGKMDDENDFQSKILPQIKSITKNVIQATYLFLSPKRQQHNFELFGLDFMVDEDLQVYLIEVNTNPCLQTQCPLLQKIKASLLENLFKICVDPLFPPSFSWPTSKKFAFGENPLEQNKFTLIFDENFEGEKLQRLYRKIELQKSMGDIGQDLNEYEDEGKEQIQEQK